ncbi:MAG: hypothetical protein HYX76_14005 [Acidobacteria bacterium]|nr:hypothetical protein [Acidobacteriota bacterium]
MMWMVIATAEDLEVAPQAEAIPAEIAAAVKATLAGAGQRVSVGDTTLDFWWVKVLPVTASTGAPDWSHVPAGSLVGIARVSGPFRDIRGRTIKAGVYTLRFGIQPANGDHLGVSPFREFLLISPASVDGDPGSRDYEAAVGLSKQTLGTSHPAVWSLDPPVTTDAPLSLRSNEAGHKAVVFELPVGASGKASGALRFGLILVGKIEA